MMTLRPVMLWDSFELVATRWTAALQRVLLAEVLTVCAVHPVAGVVESRAAAADSEEKVEAKTICPGEAVWAGVVAVAPDT